MTDQPNIVVVSDSTCYFDSELLAQHRIKVVPLRVHIDGHDNAERIDVDPEFVVAALRDGAHVTTSQPSPAAFEETYQQLIDEGAQGIISIHLSQDLSNTVASAKTGAQKFADSGVPIRVVDSRTIGLALGLLAASMGRAVQDATLDVMQTIDSEPGDSKTSTAGSIEVVEQIMNKAIETISESIEGSRSLLFVDSLKHLKRGGRLASLMTRIGTAMSIKAVIAMKNGRLVLLEPVRTSSKGLARMEQEILEYASTRPLSLMVMHAGEPLRARELADRISAGLGIDSIMVRELGAVITAHTGPGTIGVACVPAYDSLAGARHDH